MHHQEAEVVNFDYVNEFFRGKRVALFGSAPSCLENDGSEIDKYDVVVRVNNYKISGPGYNYRHRVGNRTDVHYSFFGSSIKKTQEQLKADGVKLIMCKCPDDVPHVTEWHQRNGKMNGCDFRWIYEMRKDFWFCPTFIPTKEHYLEYFEMLGKHVPTSGFFAILDIAQCDVSELYCTGYDFFSSNKHNINDNWRGLNKNTDDPIKHVPDVERKILSELIQEKKFIRVDRKLRSML